MPAPLWQQAYKIKHWFTASCAPALFNQVEKFVAGTLVAKEDAAKG